MTSGQFDNKKVSLTASFVDPEDTVTISVLM